MWLWTYVLKLTQNKYLVGCYKIHFTIFECFLTRQLGFLKVLYLEKPLKSQSMAKPCCQILVYNVKSALKNYTQCEQYLANSSMYFNLVK